MKDRLYPYDAITEADCIMEEMNFITLHLRDQWTEPSERARRTADKQHGVKSTTNETDSIDIHI
jgi:hypothetical protein